MTLALALNAARPTDADFLRIDARRPFDRLLRHERVLGTLGLLMLLSLAPTLVAHALDVRTFQGENVWLKPIKFQVALAVYLLTLTLFARWLPAGLVSRTWYRIYVGAVVAAIVAEILWISGAAALGTASHFNETPPGRAIYFAMGGAALLLTSLTAVQAWHIARNGALRLAPAFKESVVVGLALVLPLTLVTAGTMSSMDQHAVGTLAAESSRLPLIGWLREMGDMRVAHFFATHTMHFIPLAGLVAVPVFGRDARWPVRTFAAVYVALVGFTFVQALSGRPFLAGLGG